VEDVLAKVDRASMAVSLEVRVPVLDHKVVELAARMPSGWKLHGQTSKYVFKEALKKLLPGEIFTRPKTGFSIPLREWLRTDLREYTREHLVGSNGLASSGLFRKETLESLLKEHQSGLRNHSHALFALLSFSMWKSRFLDRAGDLTR
jgi:asparagine synthase (glutamine-hydrolysing)